MKMRSVFVVTVIVLALGATIYALPLDSKKLSGTTIKVHLSENDSYGLMTQALVRGLQAAGASVETPFAEDTGKADLRVKVTNVTWRRGWSEKPTDLPDKPTMVHIWVDYSGPLVEKKGRTGLAFGVDYFEAGHREGYYREEDLIGAAVERIADDISEFTGLLW